MFGYELKTKTRKETIDEVLSIIDDEIERLRSRRDEYYVKVEGYAHSKDIYEVSEAMKHAQVLHAKIGDYDLLRTIIEYRT